MSWKTSTPKRSISAGSRVGGATTRTRVPMALNRWMFERATRLWHDVAANGDREAAEAAEAPADGQRVEQGLGRVLVPAVARIDDRPVHFLREQVDGAGLRVADNQEIGAAWR